MDNDPVPRRQLDTALKECLELREELGRLRQILRDHSIEIAPRPREAPPSEAALPQPRSQMDTDAKVALFHSLFRGP